MSGFRRPLPPSAETYDNVRFSFVRSTGNPTDGQWGGGGGGIIRSVTVL